MVLSVAARFPWNPWGLRNMRSLSPKNSQRLNTGNRTTCWILIHCFHIETKEKISRSAQIWKPFHSLEMHNKLFNVFSSLLLSLEGAELIATMYFKEFSLQCTDTSCFCYSCLWQANQCFYCRIGAHTGSVSMSKATLQKHTYAPHLQTNILFRCEWLQVTSDIWLVKPQSWE